MASRKKIERNERKLKKAQAFLALVKGDKSQTQLEPNAAVQADVKVVKDKAMEGGDDASVPKGDNSHFIEMRRLIREKNKTAMMRPKVYLTPEDMLPYKPSEDKIEVSTPPVYAVDLQDLILYALQGNTSSFKPRWCRLLRVAKVSSVVAIFLDGVSYSDFVEDEDSFKTIRSSFATHTEVICPEQYHSTVADEIIAVPLSISQIKKKNVRVPPHVRQELASRMKVPAKTKEANKPQAKAGSIKTQEMQENGNKRLQEKENKNLTRLNTDTTNISPVNEDTIKIEEREEEDTNITQEDGNTIKVEVNKETPAPDIFSRVCLLLSSDQMKREGYPLPVATKNKIYKDFVFTRTHYDEVSAHSPLFAVDCEMCVTTAHRHELTRVSIVNEAGETLYDTLVKPPNQIINYLTRYSGITKEMMKDVTVTLKDVQKKFSKVLPADAILCGQSLNCDLLALKMFHPYVIDTSVIYNMSGSRGTKAGLRKLSSFFLNRRIQNHESGHCPVEDAKATLDLVKLKLQRGLDYGDATINGVYLPNIQTYFLGPDNDDNNPSVQNIENVNGDTTSPVVKQESNGDDMGNNKEEENRDNNSTTTTIVSTSTSNSLKRPHSSSDIESPSKSKKGRVDDKVKETTDPSSEEARRNFSNNMAIFQQTNGVRINQSFFKLLEEAGRTGCVVAREESMVKFEKEIVDKVSVCSDKEACKAAQDAVEKKEFTWVNFQKFRNALGNPETTAEYLKKVKEKMDHRIEKVLNKTKEKSLVIVVMTGRTETGDGAQAKNGGVFVKIS